MLHIALKRSKRINWSQTNTPSIILSPIWLTSNPRANSRLFPQIKSLKEACNIFNLVLCGKVFFPTTSLKHLEKKIEKGWWLHFLQSQMFLFFPIRASGQNSLTYLLMMFVVDTVAVCMFISLHIAWISIDFPVPLGPNKRMPHGNGRPETQWNSYRNVIRIHKWQTVNRANY